MCFVVLLNVSNLQAQNGCWKMVSAGISHTVAIKNDGTLWAWGYNGYGQLGCVCFSAPPVSIQQTGAENNWKMVSAGSYHTLAIKKNGTLWAWGSNLYGSLGDSTKIDKKTPIQIGKDSNWISVDAGSDNSFAIKKDSTLWAWGKNTNGNLGIGSNNSSLIPIQIGTAKDWIKVSAGFYHTLGVKSNGTLWAWGQNNYSQLGDGGALSSINYPKQVGIDSNWIDMSAGGQHNLSLKIDGTLWAWGDNTKWLCGTGVAGTVYTPTKVGTDSNWVSISAFGFSGSMATKKDNTLWGWGINTTGQIGNGNNATKFYPIQINADSDWHLVSSGGGHTVAIKKDSSLWVWGRNDYKQLANGTTNNYYSPLSLGCVDAYRTPPKINSFTPTSGITGQTIIIKGYNFLGTNTVNFGGKYASFSITNDSTIKATVGNGSSGNVLVTKTTGGKDSLSGFTFLPPPIITSFYPTAGTTGDLITIKGHNFTGINSVNFGDTTKAHSSNFKVLNDSCILAVLQSGASGNVYVQGNYGIGYLYGFTSNIPIPKGCWNSIYTGTNHTLAISRDGTLWSWGLNQSGQLGVGDTVNKNNPTLVSTSNDWKFIDGGSAHTLALKNDSTLWAWGGNDNGELGNGNSTKSTIPIHIGTSLWKSVSAGDACSFGIKNNGTLWAWGSNLYGQLGDSSLVIADTPTQIGTNNNWKNIYTNSLSTFGIKNDGSLWAWGLNNNAQLGVGDIINKKMPTLINPGSQWTTVTSSQSHTLAINYDGTLWAWGINNHGQLAMSSYYKDSTILLPNQINGGYFWLSIGAGRQYSAATKYGGSAWTWGSNLYGNLGLGLANAVDKFDPTEITNYYDWSLISVGDLHTVAIKKDSSIWVWGNNEYGQLGDGTNSYYRNIPYQLSCPLDFTCPIAAVNFSNINGCSKVIYQNIIFTTDTIIKSAIKSNLGCDSLYDVVNINIDLRTRGDLITPMKKAINNVVMKIKGNVTSNQLFSQNYIDTCIKANSNITYKPTKNNDITKANGLNATDVLFVQRHILNTTKITNAYKLIAADVNGDKVVNATDLLRIKRLILGTDTTFTKGSGVNKVDRLWEFVDSAYQFPDTTNPFPFKDSISFTNLTSNKINQTFIGVKLGDVNDSWNAAVARGVVTKPVEFVYTLRNEELGIGNSVVRIPITVNNFKELVALQYTLHFDNKNYEFVNLEGFKNLQGFDYNTIQANTNGNISFLWTDKNAVERTLEDGAELFTLVLRLTVDRRPSTDLQLTITNDIADIAAWDKDFNQHNIILTQKSKVETQNLNDVWSIIPNPTNGLIKVSIVSKVNKTVSFELTDAQGKTIIKQNIELQKGSNNFTLNLKQNGNVTTGVYFLKALGLEGENIKRIIVK